MVKNIPTIQEAQVQSLLSGRWSRKWQPTLVCLPGEFHGQMSQAGYSPWGRKESERGTLQRMLKRGMTKDRETSLINQSRSLGKMNVKVKPKAVIVKVVKTERRQ